MARPLRIEFPGACYQVINRGNFRFPVFRDDADRKLLLEKFVDFAERHHVRIRSYCIMVNHFHCFLQTEEANLGRFMQSFLTSFSVSYNRHHATSGHVFQGRYKAFLVEDGRLYASRVSRYIHLNPAEIPSLRNAPLAERRRVVREAGPASLLVSASFRRPCRCRGVRSATGGSTGQMEQWQRRPTGAALLGGRPLPRALHVDQPGKSSGKNIGFRFGKGTSIDVCETNG